MTDISRRSFFGRMASAVAGVALLDVDPEKLLWVPGAKTIFLPPAPTIRKPPLFGPLDQIDTVALEERGGLRRVAETGRFIEMPDRYRITLDTGESMTFNDRWEPTAGFRDGKQLTDREKALVAQRMFPAGSRRRY